MARNLASFLTDSAEQHGERTALKLDDAEVTYEQLDEASARAAALLKSKGFEEGDRVGIMLPNVPYFAVAPPRGLLARLRGRRHRAEKRSMIWEGSDGAELDGMIAEGGAWTAMYEPDRVREMLAQCRAGKPDAHFQDPLEGIVYRQAFEDHLGLLGDRAAGGPPLLDAAR